MDLSHKRIMLYIEGISEGCQDAVEKSANEQWPFQIWNQYGSYVFATGEGFFHPHENEELADRLSRAIWDANHGYCAIEIQEACVEIRPQHTYRRNRSDYDRLWADRFPIRVNCIKSLNLHNSLGR